MKTTIESLLLKKTEGKRSRILYNQWQIAKEYVPQVLGVISQVFPHYSLHDSTHSDTIINDIGRIVGIETLEKMSAIDLWLILSAAYYHDIGMSIFGIEKKEIFQSEDFSCFIKEIQENRNSPLNKYAQGFELIDNKVYYKNATLTIDNYDSARFILAEYIRKQHGERSDKTIQSQMSLSLPGSPIPNRIIEILGRICNAHTQAFDYVMDLPFCELGIDNEDCHPRYIACLLRIGDLLDMDNNRFSEVLLQTLVTIPIDSLYHKAKHMSIKHLRVDKTKIEANATCYDYEVANITNHWFSFIDKEFFCQMKNWNDIVPDVSYGYLPALGKLNVELKNYDTIDGKEPPKFKIDANRAIEMLQGAGLYSPYQCIREILQNAVDATILRIFVESEQNDNKIIDREDFYNRCKNYPITISIEEKQIDENNKLWGIKIVDNGIGMSKQDLNYLTTTGSSNKNIEKNKIIGRMPEWMKPSGTFGIGLQSIFFITNKIEITTRKHNKEDVLNITMYNPVGDMNGTIFLQTDVNDNKKYGTEIKFDIYTNKRPFGIKIPIVPSQTMETFNNFDFVNNDSLDIEMSQIVDEIYKFAKFSYVPICGKDNDAISIDNRFNEKFDYFCEDEGLELTINPFDYIPQIYYRNQIVENAYTHCHFKFISVNVNILSGNAKDILVLNRNDIQKGYLEKFYKKIINAVISFVLNEPSKIKKDLLYYSYMFVEYYAEEAQKQMFDSNILKSWENINLLKNDMQKISVKDIINHAKIRLITDNNIISRNYSLEEKDNETIEFYLKYAPEEIFNIVEFIKYKTDGRQLSYSTSNGQVIIEITKTEKSSDRVIINDWKQWFIEYRSCQCARGTMPCENKYIKLRLRNDSKNKFGYDITFASTKLSYPFTICPYIRKYNDNGRSTIKTLELDMTDKLFNAVYQYRYDSNTTLEEIKQAYAEFVKDTKDFIPQ